MGVDRDKLEIDRLSNLITGFGWKVNKQEFTEDKIIITIEKDRLTPAEGGGPGPG